jgi:hypothetical protein
MEPKPEAAFEATLVPQTGELIFASARARAACPRRVCVARQAGQNCLEYAAAGQLAGISVEAHESLG